MGRKSLKETRQKEIIVFFYKLAKKEGLENASIAKTAVLAGIPPSLVIHYFKTKEHLIYGLVEYILDKYLLIFNTSKDDSADPGKRLRQVIDNIFSKKWNRLFDDSVSYSCYSLNFRDKVIKEKYKTLLDSLRAHLAAIIEECNEAGVVDVANAEDTADMIFVLVDGSYYYLSLIADELEYTQKLKRYKEKALSLLQLRN